MHGIPGEFRDFGRFLVTKDPKTSTNSADSISRFPAATPHDSFRYRRMTVDYISFFESVYSYSLHTDVIYFILLYRVGSVVWDCILENPVLG